MKKVLLLITLMLIPFIGGCEWLTFDVYQTEQVETQDREWPSDNLECLVMAGNVDTSASSSHEYKRSVALRNKIYRLCVEQSSR